MNSHSKRKWIVALYFTIPLVDPQVAMYPMYPQPLPMQVAVPMPFPVIIQDKLDDKTTTTTTTEQSRMGIAIPVGMPMPMPFAFPGFPAMACQASEAKKRNNCPPCPPCLCTPSCTPAFFSYCSPCHTKCRCRSAQETPEPIPPRPPIMGPSFGIPMPAPIMAPPVVLLPFPPRPPRRRRPRWPSTYSSECSSSITDDSTDTDSSGYEMTRIHGKYGRLKRRPKNRRTFASLEISDNELVKPVLTYISRNGDVKIKKRLSNNEAAALMNDKPIQNINILTGQDDANQPRVLINSRDGRNLAENPRNHRRKQVVMTSANAQHMLDEGKKELVFRPPNGMGISNLSVSFQIS